MKNLDREQRIYFRNAFREARAAALRDAEGFQQILYAVERLGHFLAGEQRALAQYKSAICQFVETNGADDALTMVQESVHTNLETLYELVRVGRNSALHEGAFARRLTDHSIELALTMERALTAYMSTVGDYAVHNPVCACEWHPLSFVRQTMLANSFSYLPVRPESTKEWRLVCDLDVARCLRRPTEESVKDRLQRSLGEHIASKAIAPTTPFVCTAEVDVHEALSRCAGLPILITSPDGEHLAGIVTPFDLL